MKIYDAENQILGRLCSVIAKQLLQGEKVFVVNCEKVVLSGNPKSKTSFYLQRIWRGDPIHGPFFPKQPDGIFRRAVRGMIPWDKARGRKAYKNLKVFIGIPEELKNKKFEKVKEAGAKQGKYIQLKELSKALGGKYG